MASSDILQHLGFGLAFEIGMHIATHYTTGGALLALSAGQAVAPLLESVGISTVFTGAASATAQGAALSTLPSLPTLPAIGGGLPAPAL
ncbi:MAG: hypothetical protein ACLFP8_06800 [Alphaproteobacteria bacterium]